MELNIVIYIIEHMNHGPSPLTWILFHVSHEKDYRINKDLKILGNQMKKLNYLIFRCGWSELWEADCKNNKETLALQKFGIANQLLSLYWL